MTAPRPQRRGRSRTRADLGVTRTLDRGLALIEVLAERREASLSDLARECELSPSTALRLLETLRSRGFVLHDDRSGIYVMGIKAFVVGSAAVRSGRLDRVAASQMRQLSLDTRETVSLGVREGGHVIYIEQVEGAAALRMSGRLGARLPLHATAAGKVLMAWTWEAAVDAMLGAPPYAARTPRTLTDRSRLMDELGRVRSLGHAIDDEECEPDLRCVAAPIRDRRGDVVAALSVSSSAARLSEARLRATIGALVTAAADISGRLGWQGAAAPALPAADAMFED